MMRLLKWFVAKRAWFTTYPAIIVGSAVFYAVIGDKWSSAVNFGMCVLVLSVAVVGWLFSRHEFAKADESLAAGKAHRSAGELAYERAAWIEIHTTHSHYTVADDGAQMAGLTAVMCCGCQEVVGVIEDGAEVTELGRRHQAEMYARLRKAADKKVTG